MVSPTTLSAPTNDAQVRSFAGASERSRWSSDSQGSDRCSCIDSRCEYDAPDSRHEVARLPDQRIAADLLARWREVERALSDAGPDSAAEEALQSEAAHLRDAYQEQVKASLRAGRPELPPFPPEG
jgi:hypothetical protein